MPRKALATARAALRFAHRAADKRGVAQHHHRGQDLLNRVSAVRKEAKRVAADSIRRTRRLRRQFWNEIHRDWPRMRRLEFPLDASQEPSDDSSQLADFGNGRRASRRCIRSDFRGRPHDRLGQIDDLSVDGGGEVPSRCSTFQARRRMATCRPRTMECGPADGFALKLDALRPCLVQLTRNPAAAGRPGAPQSSIRVILEALDLPPIGAETKSYD